MQPRKPRYYKTYVHYPVPVLACLSTSWDEVMDMYKYYTLREHKAQSKVRVTVENDRGIILCDNRLSQEENQELQHEDE